jgi:hypothetical protein
MNNDNARSYEVWSLHPNSRLVGGLVRMNLGCVWLRSEQEWSGSILDSKSRAALFLCLVEGTEASYFLFGWRMYVYGAVPFLIWFEILCRTEPFHLLFGSRVCVGEWTPLHVYTSHGRHCLSLLMMCSRHASLGEYFEKCIVLWCGAKLVLNIKVLTDTQ